MDEDEQEYIEMFKKLSDQDRKDLYLNLKIIGRTDSEIAWFKNHYEQYLTKKVDI
jgi:hypothetical protein